MAPEDQKGNWGTKLRGAIYNLIISVGVEVASKSHPIALIVTVVVAIADALIVYVTKGEADFGICFDLGLQWWGDKISQLLNKYVEYKMIETEVQMQMLDKTVEGVVSVAETVGEVTVLGLQEDWKFLKGIGESVSDTWDNYQEWREENKRNTVYDENDLPCWEVPGASAGL